jgi:hypothetical protein
LSIGKKRKRNYSRLKENSKRCNIGITGITEGEVERMKWKSLKE